MGLSKIIIIISQKIGSLYGNINWWPMWCAGDWIRAYVQEEWYDGTYNALETIKSDRPGFYTEFWNNQTQSSHIRR